MKSLFYTIYWQLKRAIKNMHFNIWFFLLGHLIWPMIMVGTYYLGYTPLMDEFNSITALLTDGGSLWSYLLPGIVVLSLFGQYITIGTHLSFDRDYGILEPIFLSPVNRTLWLLGGCASIIPSGILSSFGFMISSSLIFKIEIPHPFLLVFFTLYIIIFSMPWGALVSSIFLIGRNSRLLYAIFESPAEFLSGARFPILSLPGILSSIALIYPLSHAVNILRYILVDQISWSLLVREMSVFVLLSIIYIVIAIVLFSFAEERGKRAGTLTFT